MTEHPPRKVRVLTRLKISEVSCVDKGAGEGCKVLISKRYEDDDRPLSAAEIARSKMEGRAALRDAEDRFVKQHGTGFAEHEPDEPAPTPEDDPSRFLFSKETFLRKSYAADARGDEADRHDEEVPAAELVDAVPAKKQPITFDVGDKTITARNERALARWLAVQERISKSTEDSPMPLDLSAIVKNYGVVALCKYMIESSSKFGVDEHELVKLATEDAQRKFPAETPAGAFAKLFLESRELQQAVEIAKSAALQDDVTAELERDSRAACAELAAIGKQRWPSLSSAQRFARAAETNPAILARAHRRPGPSTSFPHPVAKNLAAPVVDPKPIFVGDDTALDVDDPRKAVEQLKEQGRSRWPSASALEQFERALTDPENAELVRVAFARPTGSTSPRR